MDEKLIELYTKIQYTEDRSNYNKEIINETKANIVKLKNKEKDLEKKLVEYEYDIKSIYKAINLIQEKQKNTGIVFFLKNSWWKLAPFILSVAAVFGALGEYLYRLPPPK